MGQAVAAWQPRCKSRRGRRLLAFAAPLGALLVPALLALGGEPMPEIVPYIIRDAREIPQSLTGRPGRPVRGRLLYESEPRAGCAACHGRPGEPEARSAPDLGGLGARMSTGEIRLWLVAPEVIREGTLMPSFYAAGQRRGAADPLYGGPALTAAEIEDLVAWLASLGSETAAPGN